MDERFRIMSEIGDWLGPFVALLWILFRVLPRLFRRRSGELERPAAEERPKRESRDSDIEGSMGPPPIVPR